MSISPCAAMRQPAPQAIQIEDQEFPKKCGHTPGRRVVPIADAARRIKVAVEARSSKDFLDHRPHRCPHRARPRRGVAPWRSVPEGRRRPAVYRIAGERRGDGEDRQDVRRAAGRQHGGGRPHADPRRAELEDLGFQARHLPGRRASGAGAALRSVYGEILSTGSSKAWNGRNVPVRRFLAPDGLRTGLGVRTRTLRVQLCVRAFES